MKKRISMMIVFLMICCLAMPMTIYAAAPNVSGNDVTVDEPVVDEPVVDEPETEEVTEDETVTETTEEEEIIVEDAEEEEEEEKSGGGALAVDGYYDDWENVPQTLISYGSHNSAGTVNEYHGASMIVTDEYVYVHVRMSDLYQVQIPVDELKLTINGQEKSFVIRGRDSRNNINWGTNVYGLSDGIHDGLGVFYRDGGSVALGEAVITINDADPNDCFEFRMSIADLEALYGLPEGTIGNGAKLEFYSPNIGPEKVTVVGTPTGAYIGIALCAVVVLAAMFRQNKRKQA